MPKNKPFLRNPPVCLTLRRLASQEHLCTPRKTVFLYSRLPPSGISGEAPRMNPIFIAGSGALAAAGTIAYGAAYPRAQLFGKTICCTNSPRKLAITFDDGPNPAVTPKLLALLHRSHPPPTFFLMVPSLP